MKGALVALIIGLAVAMGGQAFAVAVAGGGKPVTNNVTNSAGGTAILLANPNRVFLFCENIGTTNNVFVTFGQTPTATNGFLLVPNGGNISFPFGGCPSRTPGGTVGTGCVPLGTVNAIASASGTNTVVCDED